MARLWQRLEDGEIWHVNPGKGHGRRRRNGSCAYCGGGGISGFVPGSDHSFSCPRYRKPSRRVLTIRARKPRKSNPVLKRIGRLGLGDVSIGKFSTYKAASRHARVIQRSHGKNLEFLIQGRKGERYVGPRPNPVGELLTVVGGFNPPSPRRSTMARSRVRHHRRRRRVHARVNPRRHVRRLRNHYRRRRNPSRSGSLSGIRLLSPMSYLPKVATAAVGGVVSASAPAILFGAGVSTTTAYLTQGGVALVGAWLVNMMLGPVHGFSWLLGAGLGIVQDPIRRAFASVTATAAPASVGMYPRLGDNFYPGGVRRLAAYPGVGYPTPTRSGLPRMPFN